MEKFDVKLLEELMDRYPASTVVRCVADTLETKAEKEGEQVARKLRHLSNALFKAANIHRYI